MSAAPYRDVHYPLNVFMHILAHEEGGVPALHYGFFDRGDESIREAQDSATAMLITRLPPVPARILDAGSGVGSTLARLTLLGYDVEGITPDPQQIAIIRSRYGDRVRVECTRFEDMAPSPFDTVVFQESSQYIDAGALFAKAREMTSHVVVFDEFAMEPATLHSYHDFLRAAADEGFEKVEDVDVSRIAAPTIDYFNDRFSRYRTRLLHELSLDAAQLDTLIRLGGENRDRYARGAFVYRVLQFRR